MIQLSSAAEARVGEFTELRNLLEGHRFSLGGDWEYERGSFDRALDDENKVWLRIPFDVILGRIDGEQTESPARIKLAAPFVLKHLYNEGNDPEASVRLFGALFDQFQSPVDHDADVEPHWVEKAVQLMNGLDRKILEITNSKT